MATVIADMTMSLDGFIAGPSDGAEHLFGWCNIGPAAVRTADSRRTFRTFEASATHLREALSNVGALIAGRRLCDVAKGWGGHPPIGRPGLRGHPQRPRRLARTPRPID
jgi:hypothetical protein